ncbi:MAG: hypothetical protein AB7S74_06130 [Hyphomicrobium sp.]
MTSVRLCLSAMLFALGAMTSAIAEENIVTPAPTPQPAAGPTVSAAQGFCGDPTATAKDLIARYSSASNLKEVYKSKQYVAYSDNEKDPTLMYTFTVEGQPAHPAAVCRRIVKEGQQVIIKMDVVCDGEAESCSKLKNDFNVMTARMQADVDAKIKSGGQ